MYSFCNCSLFYGPPCANPFRRPNANPYGLRNSFNTPCGYRPRYNNAILPQSLITPVSNSSALTSLFNRLSL